MLCNITILISFHLNRQNNCKQIKFVGTGTIICEENTCSNSNFYLAAPASNSMICQSHGACEQSNIYCGVPIDNNGTYHPPSSNYSLSDFEGNITKCEFDIYPNSMHDGFIGCHDSIHLCQVNTVSINNGQTGNESGNNFKSSQFQCELSLINSQCIIDCSDDTACLDSIFTCSAPNCKCTGSHCDNLYLNTISPSISPSPLPSDSPSM